MNLSSELEFNNISDSSSKNEIDEKAYKEIKRNIIK